MSGPTWYFHYQQKGGEDKWVLDQAVNREHVTEKLKPAFVTVLDLSSVPAENDWSTVRYRGPMYFDFDADGDLPLVCEEFQTFLLKLATEVDFDLTQASYYLSGGKGMHVEIPQACFMPKVPATGTVWLPTIYRYIAEALIVDTLDMNVYSGKRGRMWRTPGVQRESGKYKVSITLEEAMSMTPELYAELVSAPREQVVPTPASCNSAFSVLFERCKTKAQTQYRGKKKRQTAANLLLDPWIKANKTPPTIEGLMDGTLVADGVGFQALGMQLAIYAASVNMASAEFIERCRGLCENHVSDSRRYGSFSKRVVELQRIHHYMSESSLYDFDVSPLRKLVKPSHAMADLGIMETEDKGDVPVQQIATDTADAPESDMHRSLRKGFFMNADGMFKRSGENTEAICRATLRNVECFHDATKGTFLGYEFDVVQSGVKTFRAMLAAEAFTSAMAMKRFFVNHQIGFQGGDFEVMSLLDILSDKAKRGGKVYVYPREGFMLLQNPHVEQKEPVKVYLTQDNFVSSLAEDDPAYFRLQYRAVQAMSSFNIDIHKAPELDDSMRPALHDLFSFTREDVGADLIGWFVSCHYRSVYLELFNQFPLLQIYGEAGAGKSQTVWLLAHMHWYLKDISVKSAASCTPFALDTHASSSTSAPLILDEFKPRELKTQGKGKYEKLKDMFKASYIGGDIGERGTLNKGAENTLSVIKNRATAPVVFMGEAIEMETAIIERCVTVNFTKQHQTKQRSLAFNRLHSNPVALSALGCQIVQMGFSLDLDAMRKEVRDIQTEIEAGMPSVDDENIKRAAPRMIYNRAVVIHGLRVLRHILNGAYGDEFDASVDALLATRTASMSTTESAVVAVHAMSEVSKVMNRIALMSRDVEAFHEMRPNKDYLVGDGWIELRVERSYDQYRRYCAGIHDTPLFDSVESFTYALSSYSPVTDKVCSSSTLRDEGSGERVVRMSLKKLAKEGVQTFRT